MANGQQQTVLRHLHRILGAQDNSNAPDRLLLERFAATRDEAAFAALVQRHGALVWGVCWRTLHHIQDAEDCFQATFVVLARRAGSVRWRDSVANWLYGVASRVAAEARAKRTRRQSRERQAIVTPEETTMPAEAARELCAVLDEELQHLPSPCRTPLLLCYLEGRSTSEAARQLGWSQRTFERRLAQGRERLRARLIRRGLTLSGVLMGVALSEQATPAAVPARLVTGTIQSATSPGVGTSDAVLALANATSKGMAMTKLKLAIVMILLLGTTLGAGALLGKGATGEEADQARVLAASTPEAPPPGPEKRGKAEDRAAEVPGDLARRIWAILEIVEKNHRQPPPRQDILLKSARALLKAANATPPKDLAKRVSVSSEEQLRTLLRDIWPRDNGAPGAAAAKLEKALFDGLFESVPGKLHLSSETTLKIQEQLRGNRYVGIGVQLHANEKEKLPQIIIPFRRGAARRAGALPDDLILEADGKSTQGMVDMEKFATMLRGAEGTSVTIVVRQPGATETRTLKLTRAVIPIDSVYGFKRAGEEDWDYRVDAKAGIAYVWVKSIKSSTLHELRQVERHLQADGMRALVLDFRFSRGDGLLHDAGLVAGGLLDGDLMWTASDRHHPPKAWRADRDPLFRDWPVAVLVNDIEDNAQGAVLAALQDSRRAVLVGEATKADGAIRRLFHLPNKEGSITVLTGQLERANRKLGWPVRPDRPVELSKQQKTAVEKWLMAKQLPVVPPGGDQAPEDPQRAAAVAVLRDALKRLEQKRGQEGER